MILEGRNQQLRHGKRYRNDDEIHKYGNRHILRGNVRNYRKGFW